MFSHYYKDAIYKPGPDIQASDYKERSRLAMEFQQLADKALARQTL